MTDPLTLFAGWYAEAQQNPVMDPDIVALASATPSGRPSVRIVLYRGMREGGLSFFTNYESRKGVELRDNPWAAMAFYWPQLDRQVRIEGPVEKLSDPASDAYFLSRPRQSQISALLSRQSRPIPDLDAFKRELAELDQSEDRQLARAPDWGGYKLIPEEMEFWTRGEHRRHRRMQFRKEGSSWKMTLLYP